MKLNVSVAYKRDGAKYPQYVDVVLGDAELREWAQQYMEDNYTGSHEVVEVIVESIVP